MLSRLTAILLTSAFLLTGLVPAAHAVEATSGCSRSDAYAQVHYTCSGPDVDLSLVAKDATGIHITNGKVSNWTSLRSLPALRSLIVEGATNSDVKGAMNIPASVTFLDLRGPAITDLSPLSGLHLKCERFCDTQLYLEAPAASDLRPLSGLNKDCSPQSCISGIYLSVAATDFSPLGAIGHLKSLHIHAYKDTREQHPAGTRFPVPRITGLNGAQVSPTELHRQLAFVDPLTAQAKFYMAGWIAGVEWPVHGTTGNTALGASGTNVSSTVGRTYVVTPAIPKGDFSGDGKTDVLAKDAAGYLWLYPGNGRGSFLARVKVGTGWTGMTAIVAPGDLNGDGKVDIFARDSAGVLWMYPGNGKGGWLPRSRVGSGWNAMTSIIGPGDLNGDTNVDILARDKAGALWMYPGNGKGALLSRSRVGTSWNSMTAITGSDFGLDFKADVVARDSKGILWFYPGNGKGGWLPRVKDGSGWNVMTALTAPGDLNGDGSSDIVGRDSAGTLWTYPSNGGFGLLTRIKVGGGWNAMKLIV